MADPAEIEKLVVEALQTIYDPDLPVNIHELGLIYGIALDPSGGGHRPDDLDQPRDARPPRRFPGR